MRSKKQAVPAKAGGLAPESCLRAGGTQAKQQSKEPTTRYRFPDALRLVPHVGIEEPRRV